MTVHITETSLEPTDSNPEDGSYTFVRNTGLRLYMLHGVITYKTTICTIKYNSL
jgi:hypothetical protein